MVGLDLRNIANASIVLSLDKVSFNQESSTYYFAIDKGFMPETESTYKVLKNFNHLVGKWINCVESISESVRIVYLPFDFVDEYLGCLRVELLPNGNLAVEYGYTEEIQGYSVNPSQIECLGPDKVREYNNLSDTFECSRKELLLEFGKMSVLINNLLVEIK